ncbi:MAG: hypothetical protein F6K30_01980 [Cyanothece sp. SIO2G6]|nr:hypothetical protein [Cyanothece sp. SIO2G6]
MSLKTAIFMKKLTSFDIKLLAFSLMIIDHAGRFFFPQSLLPIALGRLSFPLFAWLAATGQKQTSDIKKYLLRLGILGIISQPIYSYTYRVLSYGAAPWNILFTLAFGVSVISILEKISDRFLKLIILGTFLILAEYLRVEGGSYAVLTVYFMAKFQKNNVFWYIGFTLINLTFIYLFNYSRIETISILTPLILLLYGGDRGRRARWFYPLYPLHFGALVAIKFFLS